MLNLKDFLTGGRLVKTEDILPRAKWQYKGIQARADQISDRRTPDQIWANTFHSVACEIGIARSLPNGVLNEQAFDHTDIKTWGWDVNALGQRFEIKYQKFTEDWYSMTKTIANSIIDKFQRNGFDKIITASTRKVDDDHYEIWPRLLINPDSFRRNLRKSHWPDNYKPLYYDQYIAMSDGDCQIYNEGIIKELKKSA